MNINIRKLVLLLFVFVAMESIAQKSKSQPVNVSKPGQLWSAEKANAWYKEYKWMTGANYIPATGSNLPVGISVESTGVYSLPLI